VVEVGEWRDAEWILDLALDHHREPEAELAEPHAGGLTSTPKMERARVERGGPQWGAGRGELLEGGEALEGVDEEGAGAAGRVEEAHGGEAGPEGIGRGPRVGSGVPQGRFEGRARPRVAGERGAERLGGGVLDEAGGVKKAPVAWRSARA
jgi:hypothetical protein